MKQISKPLLFSQFIIAVPVLMAVLFWPAGTLKWAEAWVYIVLQMGYSVMITLYFLKHNPELIKTRMEMKLPPELWDKIAMLFIVILMTSVIVVPGFDFRYGWSSIPVYLEVLGFIGFLISSYWIFLALKVNPSIVKTV